MKYGLSFFPTDFTIRLDELARAAETHRFDSLLVAEHTHIPTSRLTVPATGMRDLPPQYSHTLDPFVALATAAAATKTLKLGTGVCLVIERDPIILAKEVASLDLLSGGRVIFGIGAGWNVEEMENHGATFKRRWKIVKEKILAMRQIWTNEAAEFHGEFVNFDPIWSFPKPVQAGGPPILLGSQSPKTFDRLAEYCYGCMPINFPRYDLAANLKSLAEAGKKAGRNKLPVSMFGVGPNEEQLKKFLDLGLDRLIFALPPAGRETILPMLDKYADLKAKSR